MQQNQKEGVLPFQYFWKDEKHLKTSSQCCLCSLVTGETAFETLPHCFIGIDEINCTTLYLSCCSIAKVTCKDPRIFLPMFYHVVWCKRHSWIWKCAWLATKKNVCSFFCFYAHNTLTLIQKTSLISLLGSTGYEKVIAMWACVSVSNSVRFMESWWYIQGRQRNECTLEAVKKCGNVWVAHHSAMPLITSRLRDHSGKTWHRVFQTAPWAGFKFSDTQRVTFSTALTELPNYARCVHDVPIKITKQNTHIRKYR